MPGNNAGIAVLAGKKSSGQTNGKEKGEGLTPSGRTILKESMVRHDKALKILSKL